jgi:hypothetical protein
MVGVDLDGSRQIGTAYVGGLDQVTVEEWDGVDVGQPRVRLDVEA